MATTDNFSDYLTALGNSFRYATGTELPINAQDMLTLPISLGESYKDLISVIEGNFEGKNIDVPMGVTKIKSSCYNASKITNVGTITIPEGVTHLGNGSFGYLKYEKLYLPSTIVRIENSFSYNSNDDSGEVYSKMNIYDWAKIDMQLDGGNPVGVKNYVKDFYFYNNTTHQYEKLEEVNLTEEIEEIRSLTFARFNVKKIIINESTKLKTYEGGASKTVEEIFLPSTLQNFYIGFSNLEALKKFEYGGEYKGLFDININVSNASFFNTTLEDKLYCNGKKIDMTTNINVPEGVTILKKYCLANWPSLTDTIILPSTLESIENYALHSYTSKDGTLIFNSTIPPTISSSSYFITTNNVKRMFVPKGCGDVYKNATNYTKFASIIYEKIDIALNIDNSLLNNENILYSVDGGEKQQFISANLSLQNKGTLTIYNTSSDTIKLGSTNGGSEIGTSGPNTTITYKFTADTTIYITKA